MHPERLTHPTRTWPAAPPVDWRRWRAVVIESDDWGSAECCASAADRGALSAALEGIAGLPAAARTVPAGTLETVADLHELYACLAARHGADGRPAVVTAFTCTGNPDYGAIARDHHRTYADVGVESGFPGRWAREGVPLAWRVGLAKGLWEPEFHATLHHTSPALWMARLRADSPAGDAARAAFAREAFILREHLPEFAGLTVSEQHAWIGRGVARFRALFGRGPAAAVTSDAYPHTELLWRLHGVRAVCLKHARLNSGEVVVYHTKPWNHQDPYVPLGARHPELDVVYLGRNAFHEPCWNLAHTAASALAAVVAAWDRGEPAILSWHRNNWVSLDRDTRTRTREEFATLLDRLAAAGARFLCTAEVADLYRQGWSWRALAGGGILRWWAEGVAPPAPVPVAVPGAAVFAMGASPAPVPPPGRAARALPDHAPADPTVPGDYWLPE